MWFNVICNTFFSTSDCWRAAWTDPQTSLPSPCSEQRNHPQSQEESCGSSISIQISIHPCYQVSTVRQTLCGGAQQTFGEATHKVRELRYDHIYLEYRRLVLHWLFLWHKSACDTDMETRCLLVLDGSTKLIVLSAASVLLFKHGKVLPFTGMLKISGQESELNLSH